MRLLSEYKLRAIVVFPIDSARPDDCPRDSIYLLSFQQSRRRHDMSTYGFVSISRRRLQNMVSSIYGKSISLPQTNSTNRTSVSWISNDTDLWPPFPASVYHLLLAIFVSEFSIQNFNCSCSNEEGVFSINNRCFKVENISSKWDSNQSSSHIWKKITLYHLSYQQPNIFSSILGCKYLFVNLSGRRLHVQRIFPFIDLIRACEHLWRNQLAHRWYRVPKVKILDCGILWIYQYHSQHFRCEWNEMKCGMMLCYVANNNDNGGGGCWLYNTLVCNKTVAMKM